MNIPTLISRAENYADETGLTISTVSKKLFNDGKTLGRLKDGRQCTVRTLERAFERLAELESDAA